MKLGFFLPHLPPPAFEAMAAQAEALGFDAICCDDHLMNPFDPEDGDNFGCYEAWTAMAYLAGRTRKIKLDHMVLVTAFRGPALLAKMAATLDVLTGGRMRLTVGAGWYEREFKAFNIPWENHKQRIEREREEVMIIRRLWTEPQVSFSGRYYALQTAAVNPKPVQYPGPPIVIAGDSRRSMELAAELGDGWLMHGRTPEEAERAVTHIRPLLGDRADTFDIATAVVVVLGNDERHARQKFRQTVPQATWDLFMQADIKKEIRGGIYGPPRHCRDMLMAYSEAGITALTIVFPDPEDANLFAAEVLPEVR